MRLRTRLPSARLQKFPDSARANFEYAFHLQKDGEDREALERLQAAMKADPSYEEPFFFYGNLLVDQDKSEADSLFAKSDRGPDGLCAGACRAGARADESGEVGRCHRRAERDHPWIRSIRSRICCFRRSTFG